jgi:hypothetical protein
VPWIVPILYGERIDLVRTGGPVYAESGALLRRRALHPFAPNREDVYRFSGGDTVDVITLPARVIPIVRIRVEPRGAAGPADATVPRRRRSGPHADAHRADAGPAHPDRPRPERPRATSRRACCS